MKKMLSLLESIKNIHGKIRDEVVATCEQAAINELSRIAKEGEGDTIYANDHIRNKIEPLLQSALKRRKLL